MLTYRPFDVPSPPGVRLSPRQALAGTPVAAIGQVVAAASTIDIEGKSTIAEFGPSGMGRRIAITGLLAFVIFGFSFLGGMFASGGNSTIGALIALLPTAGLGYLCWAKMGTTRREGTVMFIGTEGFQVLQIAKDAIKEDNHLVYRDADIVLSEHKDVIINGAYAYSLEAKRFLDAKLAHKLTAVGTYDHPDRPSDEAFATREIGRLAQLQRAQIARGRLAQGETLVFPVLADAGRWVEATSKRMTLTGSRLEIHAGAAAQSWELAALTVRVLAGKLELVRNDNGHVVETFQNELVGNSDVLRVLAAEATQRTMASSAAVSPRSIAASTSSPS